MKKLLILPILCILFAFFFVQKEGKIIRIVDGDTFVYESYTGTQKIRMAYIDAPEHNQFFGDSSTLFLKQYEGMKANIEIIGGDKYGRKIAVLYVNNENINLKEIRLGYAWCYRYFCKDTTYINAENRARILKIGLWKYPNPINPYKFRKYHK
jgi:micrococcal nuclease